MKKNMNMKKIKTPFFSAVAIAVMLANGFLIKANPNDTIVLIGCSISVLLSCYSLFLLWGGLDALAVAMKKENKDGNNISKRNAKAKLIKERDDKSKKISA